MRFIWVFVSLSSNVNDAVGLTYATNLSECIRGTRPDQPSASRTFIRSERSRPTAGTDCASTYQEEP